MKFKIRHADSIVGIFSLAAIAGLIFFIFAIGATQNWFVKKNNYHTVFPSGSGFSTGMDLTYKGFSIGKITDVSLVGSMVRVDYYILGEYSSYVHENSLVELITSPIGLGSSFVFHPGKSNNLIPPESEIFRTDSREGRQLIEKRLIWIENQSDSIGALMNKVTSLLDNVNFLIGTINEAARGRGNTPVKQIVGNINDITKNIADLTKNLASEDGAVPHLLGQELSENINNLLVNLSSISDDLSGVTGNVNKLVSDAAPEIQSALMELNLVMQEVQDVLTGVKNNPLIRGGVPDRSSGDSSTTKIRDTDF